MLQKANSRALASGATPETAFALARNLRTVSETPMVLLTYANIVYRRGIDRFYADAHAAGIDGVLIVDVPVEEAEPYLAAARREEINQIFLIAPTTSTARIIHTASVTGGYIYIVSVPGVTGARSELSGEVIQVLHTVRRYSPLPLAVGFGISSPTQVRTLCAAGADGIIIGSAFADIIERYAHDPAKMLQEVQDFAGTIRDAIPDAAAAETEERP
jgi:tryptophan synthase alpha chain